MSNFSPKLEHATEKELRYMVNELDFRVVHLASDELTRRTLDKLQETIEVSNVYSEKLEKANYKLQMIMVVLTLIGTLVIVFPILKIIFEWITPLITKLLNTPTISANSISTIAGLVSIILTFIAYTQIRIARSKIDNIQNSVKKKSR